MAYTKEETILQLNKLKEDIDNFYKHCPYRKGNLKGSTIPSDEFIAKYIIDNLLLIENNEYLIKDICLDKREKYFDKVRRKINKKEGSQEEIFQRYIYFEHKLDDELASKLIGEDFIWFEFAGYPKVGKGIDLISYNKTNRLTIYELKFGDVNEHLLKAILEIQTYYQRTRYDKLKIDWEQNWFNCNKPQSHYEKLKLEFDEKNIRKVLLLDRRTLAFKQFSSNSDNTHLLELLKIFGIEVIEFDGEKYKF